MGKYASKVVSQAKAWLNKKESDGSHKSIIDIYNKHTPLARGYKVTYKDAWCVTFVSAVAIKLGYTSIIPTECGCEQMIELFKKLGSWVENENRTPSPGDIVFYDWQDNGVGDNVGYSDHVGIVTDVSGNSFTIIEGNYNDSVKERELQKNARYIRGYGVPKYDKEVSKPIMNYTIKKGDTLSQIAKMYDTTVKNLILLNSALIADENDIQVGWVISVPGSKPSEKVAKPSKDYEAIGKAVLKCSDDIKKLESYADLMTLL